MKFITKYRLFVGSTGLYKLVLPIGSIPRYVGIQGTDICIWVEVDPEYAKSGDMVRTFHKVGDNWEEIGDNEEYIGTAQIGEYVWHVYEVIETS